MKLEIVAIFGLVALVSLVAGRAQEVSTGDSNTVNFFPAPGEGDSNGTTTNEEPSAGGAESVGDGSSSGDVGGVETFGFILPFLNKHHHDTTKQGWNCICDGSIKFEDVHGKVCTCDSPLRSVCDTKFKTIKEKCFKKGLTCRTKEMNHQCAAAIRCYFNQGCCADADRIDDLLAQAQGAMYWYGCGYCKPNVSCD